MDIKGLEHLEAERLALEEYNTALWELSADTQFLVYLWAAQNVSDRLQSQAEK